LDPRYALAYAGLTDVYTNLTPRGRVEPTDGRARARHAAQRALAIDPDLAEAHAAIGQTHVYSAPYDFANGDRALRRAIELSPSWAIAHQYLGVSLLEQGRADAALAQWETARQLDPLSAFITRLLAHAHLVRRDYPRSLTLLREANQLSPPFAVHSEIEIYIQNDAVAEALEELERLSGLRDSDPYLLFAAAMASASQGKRTDALAIGSELASLGDQPLTFAFLLAKLHLTLGNIDNGLELLERGLDANTIPIVYPGAPVWDPVRTNPRFKALLTRMGIPAG
jgi:tetratricopeptide (TPR) repeat protein